MKVLFVCSGNICRSPMAAELLRDRAVRSGLSHLVVDSAGLLGIDDAPASPEACEALKELGLDLSGHRSKGLTEVDLKTADLVIAMTRGHVLELLAGYPRVVRRPLLLRAFEHGADARDGAPDAADPIGRPLAFYREQIDIFKRCIEHLTLYLKHLDPASRDV